MDCDILLLNIDGLVQVRTKPVDVVAGAAMQTLPILSNAFLAIRDGRITAFGPMDELPLYSAKEEIDATGRFVFPSFVDSHTHLVFAASREEEFVMKIRGASYSEIAAKGGGILNSARKLRSMSDDELLERTLHRAAEITTTGTGAVEIKSGYGLSVRDEIRMLRVGRQVGKETRLTVKTTLLGAHAVPEGMTRSDYVDVVVREMIPAAAEGALADYVDVFCEEGFFSPEDTERIVEEGKRFGMKPRIHANQLNKSGGVQVGVKTGALSVDHLENIGDDEIAALKGSKTVPTALPGAAFFLDLPFPPARKIIEAGLPLAVASDYNPGSAPSGNMPLMLSLACIRMKMTPEEAINATTINTASTLELSDSYGSITAGKVASLFITKPMPSVAFMPYSFGWNPVDKVILKGQLLA